MQTPLSVLGLTSLLAAAASTLAAEPAAGGKFTLNLRPRYEQVEQANKPETAYAWTLRTLAGWESDAKAKLGGQVQLIAVNRLAEQEFNDDPARAAASRFPTVADPDDVDINQATLDWRGLPNTLVRLGRQSIKLHNVRFVGNVEFRQVMQVFNGLRVENRSLPNTELVAGHMSRIKTIFGTQREMNVELFNVNHQFAPAQMLIGYAYLIDAPITGSATGFRDNSNRSFGVRLDGARPMGEDAWKLLYTAEFADQQDYADGDSRIDARYLRVGAGWQGKSGTFVRLDVEQLGSNDGVYGFQTPLGTNHLFQGWADVFLTTPAQGIRDTFVTAGGKIDKLQWLTEVHDFKSDFGDNDFGSEWDFSLAAPLGKQVSAKLEYADFQEGDVTMPRRPDTRKIWLTLNINW